MKHCDKDKLAFLLEGSVEGRIGLEEVMREITMFENTKSDTVVTSACHELRHFHIDADLRARDHAYDTLMKKRLNEFIGKLRRVDNVKP